MLLVWPQWRLYSKTESKFKFAQKTLFRCCKLLLSIVWRGEETGLREKEKHMKDVACLEPFLEAAPQVNQLEKL